MYIIHICAHTYNTFNIYTYIEYLQVNIPITKKKQKPPQASCCGRVILKAKAPKFTNTLYYNKFIV